MSSDPVESAPRTPSKGRIWWEIAIVLGIGLGQSAVYAIVQLAYLLSQPVALGDQETTLNPSLSDREIFDFIYQMLDIIFSLGPVVLVCFLLWNHRRPHLGRLGLDTTRVWRDVGWGVVLVVAIGIPGMAIYLGGRALGIGVAVDAAGLDPHWWTIPVLLLSALRSGIQEEVVVLGYLFARLKDLGWNKWGIIASSAVLRGTYHLYQGFGAFVGNLLMGLLFGWLFTRTKRLLPFVIAHFLLDAAIFVGYPWAAATFPGLFGPSH